MAKPRILVVDDELSIRVLVSVLLEGAGYEPLAVASVERALERLDDEHVDLVLTDLQMPLAGGLELLACLRLTSSPVPVVVMTASDDADLVDEAFVRGATALLRKPFSPERLRQTVQAVLEPRAAALLYWHPLGRQVRAEGTVERVSREESEEYFRSRPRGSQLGAVASRQSEPVASREELDARLADLDREYEGRDVPLPEFWGGYRIVPESWEFWQHRDDRLHDRLVYVRDGSGWRVERLQP